MAGNKSLNAAAKAKQDEFYTQLTDISGAKPSSATAMIRMRATSSAILR